MEEQPDVMDLLPGSMPLGHRRPVVLGVSLAFLIMAHACCTLRFYVRLRITRCPGWDDLLLLLSLVTTSVSTLATCIAREHGLGEHFADLGDARMKFFIKSFYVCNGAYCVATSLIKTALLLQYLRVLPKGSRRWRASVVLACVTVLWGISYSAVAWVPCLPISAHWDFGTKPEFSWGFGSENLAVFSATYISHVATNMALDVAVSTVPLTLVLGYRPDAASLPSIVILFLLGLSVNGIGLFRLVSIAQSRAGTYPDLDPSWYACVPAVLATVEVNLATICASLPIFWPEICSTLSRILVTREVIITAEERKAEALAGAWHHGVPDEGGAVAWVGHDRSGLETWGRHAGLGLSGPTRTEVQAAGRVRHRQ